MRNVILIRGLQGSGKSTLAQLMEWKHQYRVTLSANDFFYDEHHQYNFEPSKLPEAHSQCIEKFLKHLTLFSDPLRVGGRLAGEMIIVNNTFSCRWEMQPYINLANDYDFTVTVIDLFDNGMTDEELAERGIHDVPVENIQAMRSRWEHDWKNGNPLPPWERKENQEKTND